MNNFHYIQSQNIPKSDKATKLVQQLQAIEKELQVDHKKLAQKRRLQQQFYEDAGVNRMNLADQIMNQLLNPRAGGNAVQPKNKFNQFEGFKNVGIKEQPQYYDNRNVNNARNLSPDLRINDPIPAYQNPGIGNQYRPVPKQIPKQNQIVNKRQMQKMRLQNMNAQQQFPFGNNSREKDRKNEKRFSPEREPPMKDNFIQVKQRNKQKVQKQILNPFIKDEPTLKEKRQQEQRRYRILLQQQMQQQKKRKQQQKLRLKQQQRQKYNNIPVALGSAPIVTNQNKGTIQNMNKKRRDPNAQHTPLEKPNNEIRQSDLQFMKIQVLDLKNKFKKGRINHEQYESQIKKLQSHYKIKADQVIQNQIQQKVQQKIDRIQNQPQNIPEQSVKNSTQRQKNPSIMQYNDEPTRKQLQFSSNRNRSSMIQTNNQYAQHYPNTSVPIQSMNRLNQPSNYPNYQPSSMPNVSNQPTDFQMQMMFKLLDEFKSIFKMQTESHLNDKKVLQQTLNKMIPNFNPIMMTQQLPPTVLPQPPKQFHTEVKRVQKFDQFPRNNLQGGEYSQPPSQSQISSSYIEKSLSGIINKIPLTKKQKQQEKSDPNKDIVKFYQRKYKIKKFKGFEYTQTQNQSSMIIPSVSNYLQTKNSQNELSATFERDLRNYKKLQKDRDLQMMMQKIKKSKEQSLSNSSNSNSSNPSNPSKNEKKRVQNEPFSHQTSNFYQPEQAKKTQGKQVQQNTSTNPFLKKHISNQSNQSQPSQANKSNKYNSYQIATSPAPKSSQILQQQEYQTENKRSDSDSPQNAGKNQNKNFQKLKRNERQTNTYNAKPFPTNSQPPPLQNKTSSKDYPSSKILNIMKTNNEILAKYERSPQQSYQSNYHQGTNSISSVKQSNRIDSSKEFSSREYFSGHQISPVQRRQYQSSLETVRSQEQSGKFERKNNMDLLMMGSNQRSSYSNNYQSPIPSAHSIHASPPTIQSMEAESYQKNYEGQSSRQNDYYKMYPNIGHSQTVESIQQSESKLPIFQKPPNNNSRKSARQVSRKKESVIKIGNNSNENASYKDQLSGIPSQGSKQKSSYLKNLSSQQNQSKLSSAKFDSGVYQSGYEQTVELKSNYKDQGNKLKNLNQNSVPNTFKQVLQKNVQLQKSAQSKDSSQNANIRYTNQQLQNEPEPQEPIKPSISVPKWRSLQQARKIAKQCRVKSGQDSHNRSSVQQKLSQLESFIQNPTNISQGQIGTIKKDELGMKVKKDDQKPQTTNKKKDISKILDDLGEDQYQPDFDSYKQQSER